MKPDHRARGFSLIELNGQVAMDLIVDDGKRLVIALDDVLARGFVAQAASILQQRLDRSRDQPDQSKA
jgi:hypothetical protein